VANFSGFTTAPLLFHKDGFLAPDFSTNGVLLSSPTLADTFTSVDEGSAAVAQNNLTGFVAEEGTPGLDWFEHAHIVPRSLDFGDIAGVVERDFEIYNAYRHSSILLTIITNNALPGLEIPDVVAPSLLAAQSSFLDPSSTDNHGGTGLGTLVRTVMQALPQGLPVFDTTVVFDFASGDSLTIGVSGRRISLISAQPEAPMIEGFGFLTDIIESVNGNEQRLSLRKQPRQVFKFNYALDGTERQRMQALLFGWQPSTFAVPLWHEAVQLTANASLSATSVSVNTTTDVDFRVGGLAVVFESATKFDVVEISAVAANTITFTASPLLNAYTAGPNTKVMPVRLCQLDSQPRHQRPPKNLEYFSLEFRCTDNDTGAPLGSTAGWHTYLGKVLLDDCNIEIENAGDFQQRITVIDNDTGVVYQTSQWDRHRRTHKKGFRAGTRAEVALLRKLLLALRGRQVSFWIPTFNEDLTPVANLTSATSVMDIEHIGYTRFVASREPKKTFRITFTDGSQLMRVIQSSTEISSTVERLVLDTTWPSTKTPAQVTRIEFFEKIRFDTDEFELEYDRPGQARLIAPVKVVFE